MRSDCANTATATSPSGTAPASLVSQLRRLLISRDDRTLRWATGPGKAHWYYSKTRLTDQDIAWALEGKIYLGIYAVGRTGFCRWLAMDSDDEQSFRGIVSMASVLASAGNVLVERSRRGGHVWLLCPPTPWQEVVAYGHFLTQEYGLRKIELYPPSGELKALRFPGSRNPKDRKIHPFLDPLTGEVIPTLDQAIAALTPRPFPRVKAEVMPERVLERADPFSNVMPPPTDPAGYGDAEELRQEISKITTLRYMGNGRWSGLCPWHADHHPSLGVMNAYWRCFAGCGHGGLNAWRKLVRERVPTPR